MQLLKLYVYIIRRLILLIPVLIGVTLITFFISRIDVQQLILGYLGHVHTQEAINAVIGELHLNGPEYQQYFYYLGSLFTGKWGYLSATMPFDAGTPVMLELQRRFPPTAELALIAIVLLLAMAIPLGASSAVRKDRGTDHATRLIAMAAVSIPIFWLGILVVMVLASNIIPAPFRLDTQGQLNWSKFGYTSTGMLEPFVSADSGLSHPTGFLLIDTLIYGDLPAFWDAFYHVFWPALVVAVANFGIIIRFLRSSMLEVLGQDFVRTARSKGVPESFVIKKHVRRNALGSTTTVMGLLVAILLGGVIVTENVFGWPGMGTWIFQAAFHDDLVSIMATTFVFTIIVVSANLIVDIIYAYLDPRVRLE